MALDQVLGAFGGRVGHGGLAPALLAPSFEARPAHQPTHPAPTAADPLAPQLGVDTRTAVGSPGGGVDGGDLL
ncbi:MAG: hypothetical protein M0Z95_03415, partial [Actinomycetota bacterium]|nr:hypothetical protein [Actinomycetota bacterium]